MTPYHAKYFAHELTRHHPTDSLQKMTAILSDAQVELNPHQVEAALFAFRSPLSKGAILADEVGLGKTIEAGLVLSQHWAEQRRKLLIIVPANLRKQWSQELREKFFLPSIILDKGAFEAEQRTGQVNPFEQRERIVICSYQFARSKARFMRNTAWDLCIIDEAHRLRNAWRPENKIGSAIKTALQEHPKLLLTATPLQNSLMELYGLISIIDEHVFGDLASFRSQFLKLNDETSFAALRQRLQPICKRTLRRQVLEYVRYTNRIPITQDFILSDDEAKLHNFVNDYLREERLYALPGSQRALTTLILRKLLASSTFAISATLGRLASRLERQLEGLPPEEDVAEMLLDIVEDDMADVETYVDEIGSGISDDDSPEDKKEEAPPDPKALRAEVSRLRMYQSLSENIQSNSKGEVLKLALQKGFEKLSEIGAARKAIIFTESLRTQQYLKTLLEAYGFGGQLVMFNGSNNDPHSQQVYRKWLEKHKDSDMITGSKAADIRAALTEYFREEATIMVATEAAAEGINLQFCSLVVNYDLPWNPQRIEQRIGRCHRYGQKHDVVVINFLNRDSETEVRVFEILEQKFKLFSGVFGASDEVLGSLESGVDFEKRIADIYQNCRSNEEINLAFESLRTELEPEIGSKMDETRQQLLENFDEEVVEKLRISLDQSMEYINRYEQLLWRTTQWFLQSHYHGIVDVHRHTFHLHRNPFPEIEEIPLGKYRFAKNVEDAHRFRAGHPLAKNILEYSKTQQLGPSSLVFEYRDIKPKITVLKNKVGSAGWLQLDLLSVTAFVREEHLVFSCITDEGEVLSETFAQRLFSLPAREERRAPDFPGNEILEKLNSVFDKTRDALLAESNARTAKFFDYEIDKLDRWADDVKYTLEAELREMDKNIALLKAEAKKSPDVEQMLKAQRQVKDLERLRKEKRQQLFREQDDVEDRKDRLMDDIRGRLNRQLEREGLFLIRWKLVG